MTPASANGYPCKNDHQKLVAELKTAVAKLKNEIEKIFMERIEDKENRAVYDSMVAKRRDEIAKLQARISEYADLDKLMRERKASMKTSIDLLDEIVAAGAVTDAHLRMLVDKIIVCERKDEDGAGTHLDLEILLNANFRIHFDEFDQGELSDRSFALCGPRGYFPDPEEENDETIYLWQHEQAAI